MSINIRLAIIFLTLSHITLCTSISFNCLLLSEFCCCIRYYDNGRSIFREEVCGVCACGFPLNILEKTRQTTAGGGERRLACKKTKKKKSR